MTLEFQENKGKPLLPPFDEIENSEGDKVVVIIHTNDTDINDIEDGNPHVYFRSMRGTLVFEAESKSLYVVKTGDDEIDDLLVDFLENHGFMQRGHYDDRISRKKKSRYSKFISEIELNTSGSLEEYIRNMFTSMEMESIFENKVKLFMEEFYVALTAEDINPNPLSNYELLEFLGDYASWSPLNKIFIRDIKSRNREITQSLLTSYHRSFASKSQQSKISKQLSLSTFLKKKDEITMDTHEDIFESFMGALCLIDFKIGAFTGRDHKLVESFLEWVYQDVDFGEVEEIPEITKFYGYMRLLFNGKKIFREEVSKEKNSWRMYPEKKSIPKSGENLDLITELSELLGEERSIEETATVQEIRRNTLKQANDIIEEKFTLKNLREMKNRLIYEKWDEDLQEEFLSLVPRKYILNEWTTNRKRNESYFVLQDHKGKSLYSTANLDDGGNPETLIALMKGYEITQLGDPELVEYTDQTSFFKKKGGKRFFLKGTPSQVEDYVKKIYNEKLGAFYVEVESTEDTGKGIFIKYNPSPVLTFDIEKIRRMLEIGKTEYTPEIYRYIGDRAAYTRIALILICKLGITNEHHLTIFKNFLRSKEIKEELTRLLNIEDSTGQLISFDELMGMNVEKVDEIINHIFTTTNLNPLIIDKPEKRLKTIRFALYNEFHRKKVKRTQEENAILNKQFSISEKDGYLLYTSHDDVRFGVETEGRNRSLLKSLFAKEMINYELEKNGADKVYSLVNSKFSRDPNYPQIKRFLEGNMFEYWTLSYISGKKILLEAISKSEIRYYSGNSLEAIVSQFY